MLSAFLRPFQGNSRNEDPADLEHDFTPRPSIAEYRRHLHATADFTEADDDDEESNDGRQPRYPLGGRPDEDEDGLRQSAGLLPLFSASHLDSLPIYSMTHAIRIIVQARTETTLSWEQLRSPQISQFLVKPMLQQIRTQHFSPGTLYALMANCLQFEKEAQLHPGNAGISGTRARVCELLALKLLKEYTTRELIDALCYDFYPLQGIPGSQSPLGSGGARSKPAALRTSTLEVAIRASAKHFLSHPLVVQQLEAIWNGAISFHPAPQDPPRQGSMTSVAGSNQSRRQSTVRTPLLGDRHAKEELARLRSSPQGRRSVSLYNPRTASLFKLSRLRVPRYRRILSTCSLVILVGLFLAVLSQRSSRITALELLFWFWSAGFMLDELVGFNEQGVSFYIMSFWNIFDLGILLLLIVYYCMRIYGVFLLDPHKWNENAYDVLAVNAILLLPRIFGVLDHYRYFSQLLIALRLLAIDLAAVFLLILICFSGFFVFFVSSKNQHDPYALAYKIFQITMGFTPAAWEMWPSYGWMGKALMGLFLIICHFVVITLLVTVLTNSFMSITSRTNQEYQFCFAVSTISMVKNEAIFSYVAPSNLFAWALMPLRSCMPLDQYVWLNRAVIKVTHFPLLFCICFYEKYFLATDMYEATDLVDRPRRSAYTIPFSDPASRSAFFSPSIRVREESVVGYQKDRALEEVFRCAPDMRTQRRNERRKTQNAIRSWMDQHDGGYTSPQNYSTIDSRIAPDWQRRASMNPERPSRFPRNYSDIRSAASDPADFVSEAQYPMAPQMYNDGVARRDYATEVKDSTDVDADGDDELVTNDEDEEDNATNNMDAVGGEAIEEDYFTTPIATRFTNAELTSLDSPRPPTSRRIALHARTLSNSTILYAPEDADRPYSSSSASAWPAIRPTPVATPTIRDSTAGRRSPRRALYMAAAARPRSMVQTMARTAPNRTPLTLEIPTPTTAIASSKHKQPTRRRSMADLAAAEDESTSRVNRLMLAKMKSLEESLGDMVREMRVLRQSVPNTAHNSDDADAGGSGGGSGGKASASWGKETRSFVGSDHSLGDGGGSRGPAVIEIAGSQHHSLRETGRAGGRRARAGTVIARRTPPSYSGYASRRTVVGRSPKDKGRDSGEGGSEGIAGLGIGVGDGSGSGSGSGDRRVAKGKEREVSLEQADRVGGASPPVSPDRGDDAGFAEAASL